MTDLKCVAANCTYNKDNLCAKGDICVGGKHADCIDQTCCESFLCKKEGFDAFVSSISHPSRTISIDCEAEKCVYNDNFKCSAPHIDRRGSDASECENTACATFYEK